MQATFWRGIEIREGSKEWYRAGLNWALQSYDLLNDKPVASSSPHGFACGVSNPVGSQQFPEAHVDSDDDENDETVMLVLFDIVIVDVCDDVDDDADKVGRGPGWEPVHCRPAKEATDAEPP